MLGVLLTVAAGMSCAVIMYLVVHDEGRIAYERAHPSQMEDRL